MITGGSQQTAANKTVLKLGCAGASPAQCKQRDTQVQLFLGARTMLPRTATNASHPAIKQGFCLLRSTQHWPRFCCVDFQNHMLSAITCFVKRLQITRHTIQTKHRVSETLMGKGAAQHVSARKVNASQHQSTLVEQRCKNYLARSLSDDRSKRSAVVLDPGRQKKRTPEYYRRQVT